MGFPIKLGVKEGMLSRIYLSHRGIMAVVFSFTVCTYSRNEGRAFHWASMKALLCIGTSNCMKYVVDAMMYLKLSAFKI